MFLSKSAALKILERLMGRMPIDLILCYLCVLTHSRSQCVELSKSIKFLVLIAFAQNLGCKKIENVRSDFH